MLNLFCGRGHLVFLIEREKYKHCEGLPKDYSIIYFPIWSYIIFCLTYTAAAILDFKSTQKTNNIILQITQCQKAQVNIETHDQEIS